MNIPEMQSEMVELWNAHMATMGKSVSIEVTGSLQPDDFAGVGSRRYEALYSIRVTFDDGKKYIYALPINGFNPSNILVDDLVSERVMYIEALISMRRNLANVPSVELLIARQQLLRGTSTS
jgi:hypothetical protein